MIHYPLKGESMHDAIIHAFADWNAGRETLWDRWRQVEYDLWTENNRWPFELNDNAGRAEGAD
jgi:hypothetical protein